FDESSVTCSRHRDAIRDSEPGNAPGHLRSASRWGTWRSLFIRNPQRLIELTLSVPHLHFQQVLRTPGSSYQNCHGSLLSIGTRAGEQGPPGELQKRSRKMLKIHLKSLTIAALALVSAGAILTAGGSSVAAPKHLFFIMMENH